MIDGNGRIGKALSVAVLSGNTIFLKNSTFEIMGTRQNESSPYFSARSLIAAVYLCIVPAKYIQVVVCSVSLRR